MREVDISGGTMPYLHARQVNKIAQCGELPQAQYWHQISVLLHREPHKPYVQQRVVSGGRCPAVSLLRAHRISFLTFKSDPGLALTSLVCVLAQHCS